MNSFSPHITVACVVEKDGKFLFVRELSQGREVLNQPAGHVEFGETLEQAAYRETLEESAWQVDVTALVGWYIFQPYRGAGVYYRACFAARPVLHDPQQKLDTGIIDTEWLTPAELAERHQDHRSPLVSRCLDDYINGRRLPLDSIYQHPWPLQRG